MGWTAGRTDHLALKFEEEVELFKACPEYEPTQQKLRACIQAEVAGLLTRNEDENARKFARLTQELNASSLAPSPPQTSRRPKLDWPSTCPCPALS